ncbi:MAG TPA: GNAT family N-acetyltransferase [Thermodesulfobacteriota bacterium]|nr:GNAT family N-acetyltransferase [Thermodesulfobacteriota bacterium]
MEILIRPWQKGDLATISKISLQSWISTYSGFIPESDIRSYFETHYTEASLLRMFDDPFVQGFVAETGSHIVGYVRLVFNRDENRLYIPSLHVLSKFQSRGIGRQLLETAERCAAGKGLNELWIGAMVKNRRALALYREIGFLFVQEEPFTVTHTTVSHIIGFKKLGREPLLRQKTQATFEGGEGSKSLPGLCFELLSEQQKTWEELRQGCESFKDIRERDIDCRGFSIRLQYNPGRMKSSTAPVGEREKNEHPCFLCLDHLPEAQKGIFYRGEYLILCNPMPILPSHFTISHVDHRRQAADEHIDTFLHLMTDLGPRWTVLYNGPKCGASAPDHLHFQVALSGKMPIEKNIREEKRQALAKPIGGVLLYRLTELGREVVVLEGSNPSAMADVFQRFLNALRKVLLRDAEPMINMAGFCDGKKWRLVIFPRRKHRPDAFFKEGGARMVISPGAIDMGGFLITPVAKDFERLDAATVEGIYREVSLESEIVEKAISAL